MPQTAGREAHASIVTRTRWLRSNPEGMDIAVSPCGRGQSRAQAAAPFTSLWRHAILRPLQREGSFMVGYVTVGNNELARAAATSTATNSMPSAWADLDREPFAPDGGLTGT